MSEDQRAELRRLAHELLADEMAEAVALRVDDEMATVSFGDERQVQVPLSQVVVSEGNIWVRVPANIWAEFPPSRVTVQAFHSTPTPETIALAVSELPQELVNAMMSRESSLGSAEDSIGLIALRAICGLLRGDKPGDYPAPDETLEG